MKELVFKNPVNHFAIILMLILSKNSVSNRGLETKNRPAIRTEREQQFQISSISSGLAAASAAGLRVRGVRGDLAGASPSAAALGARGLAAFST